MTIDDDYGDIDDDRARLVEVVEGLLANRSRLGPYDVGRSINRAILNDGAELVANHRRMGDLVAQWEVEASAPTGMHEDPQEQVDQLRSEMDGEYDRGRMEIAEAVRAARASRKVLLEPDTCKLVVDLDHDGKMSGYLRLNVPEVFGLNPDYDPQAAVRLREMTVNSGVDFSRAVDQERQHSGRQLNQTMTRQPTPIREALNEEITKLRDRQGFNQFDPDPAGPHRTPTNDDIELG